MSLKNFIESGLHSFNMKAESLAPSSAYLTNGAGFTWGAITFNQWVMGITLILGLLTFVVNLYFQAKRHEFEKAKEERERELHDLKMMVNSKSGQPPKD